jgi:hypothetical protein
MFWPFSKIVGRIQPLDKIMTTDETWVSQYDSKTKCRCPVEKFRHILYGQKRVNVKIRIKTLLICIHLYYSPWIYFFPLKKSPLGIFAFRFCNIYCSILIEKDQMFGWVSRFCTPILLVKWCLAKNHQWWNIHHALLICPCETVLCSWT